MLMHSTSLSSCIRLQINPRTVVSAGFGGPPGADSSATESNSNSPASMRAPGSHSICMKNSLLSPSKSDSDS